MDFLDLYILPFVVFFGVLCIHQDVRERKVSNYLTFPFVILSFVYFLLNFWDMAWFDYILTFIFIFVAYYLYKRGTWGAADGKIFLGILLVLMGFGTSTLAGTNLGGSAYFLRFILNLLIFYILTILFMIIFCTKKGDKVRILKEVDFLENGLIIILLFIVLRVFLSFLNLNDSSPFFIIIVFLLILVLIDLLKKFLKPHLAKLPHDVRLMVFFLFFGLMMIYGGGFVFLIVFLLILAFRIVIQVMGELSSEIGVSRRKKKDKYQSPFSVYLFFSAAYTLVASYSIFEMILILIG